MPYDREAKKYTPKELEVLAVSDVAHDRVIAGMSEGTPLSSLRELMGDDESYVRAAVGRNKRTPEEALLFLAEDFEGFVRNAVAANENTSPEVLRKLVKQVSAESLTRIANKAVIPLDVAEHIVKVRVSVPAAVVTLIRNSACPLSLVKQILDEEASGWITRDVALRQECIQRIMNDCPEFAGYPYEWVETQFLRLRTEQGTDEKL